jgi:hypothetical protein
MNYYQKARSSNLMNSPIDKNELNKAQNALQSLKSKMVVPPSRRPLNNIINIGHNQSNRFIPTFDIEMMKRGPVNTNANILPNQNTNKNEFNININKNAKPQFASPVCRPCFNNLPKTTISGRRPMLARNNVNNAIVSSSNDPNDERALDLNGKGNKELESKTIEQHNEPTCPCPDCGRTFNCSVIDKHVKICKKVFQEKRKAFDSKASRVSDPEQAMLMRKGEMKEKRQAKQNNSNNNINNTVKTGDNEPKWKKQSEEFRNIIHGKATNIPSVLTNDYTLCQYCNRKYNEQAYNKHLEGCKRRFHEAQIKNKGKVQQSNNNNHNTKVNSNIQKMKYRSGK